MKYAKNVLAFLICIILFVLLIIYGITKIISDITDKWTHLLFCFIQDKLGVYFGYKG